MSSKRYCFVSPRFFKGLAGGAETLLGALAVRLARRGEQVELLTTCAKDNRTWANEFAPGETMIDGVRVIRFPVDERDLDRWVPIQHAIHGGGNVSYDDQLTWMRESVNSTELYAYLARYGEHYDAIIFGPYLFGTTFWGSQIIPEKSILVPCLHDEAYAYLDVIAAMFRGVRGCIFNAEAEMHLARSLYGDIRGGVVGLGFDAPLAWEQEDATSRVVETGPYILYLGRKEMGKNAHLLIDYFCAGKDRGLLPPEIRLVILGGGNFSDLHRDDVLRRGDIIDLPHASEEQKGRVLKDALYLCQPSKNESFSIVLMEAWMAGTPVVVHSECAVTRQHVIESQGGLYMSSPEDLVGVTRYMLENPDARREFAARGRRYVRENYSWDAVLRRFDHVTEELTKIQKCSDSLSSLSSERLH